MTVGAWAVVGRRTGARGRSSSQGRRVPGCAQPGTTRRDDKGAGHGVGVVRWRGGSQAARSLGH